MTLRSLAIQSTHLHPTAVGATMKDNKTFKVMMITSLAVQSNYIIIIIVFIYIATYPPGTPEKSEHHKQVKF